MLSVSNRELNRAVNRVSWGMFIYDNVRKKGKTVNNVTVNLTGNVISFSELGEAVSYISDCDIVIDNVLISDCDTFKTVGNTEIKTPRVDICIICLDKKNSIS